MTSTITTRVARADWGENQFLGNGVIDRLAGNETFAGVLALAVSGRRLSRDEAGVVDDIAVCTLAAEPRIWPLKLARITASYGSALAGYAAGHVMLEGAVVGPWSTGLAATLLSEMRAEVGDDWTSDDVDRIVEHRIAAGKRFPGYGVAFRPVDERVGALEMCLTKRGRATHPYWRLMRDVERALCKHKKLPANVGAADAAAGLDIGLSPSEIAMLVTACTSLSFIPNVLEAAQQRHPLLRSLPTTSVRYIGPEPRLTPRARAKQTLDSTAPVLSNTSYR